MSFSFCLSRERSVISFNIVRGSFVEGFTDFGLVVLFYCLVVSRFCSCGCRRGGR